MIDSNANIAAPSDDNLRIHILYIYIFLQCFWLSLELALILGLSIPLGLCCLLCVIGAAVFFLKKKNDGGGDAHSGNAVEMRNSFNNGETAGFAGNSIGSTGSCKICCCFSKKKKLNFNFFFIIVCLFIQLTQIHLLIQIVLIFILKHFCYCYYNWK